MKKWFKYSSPLRVWFRNNRLFVIIGVLLIVLVSSAVIIQLTKADNCISKWIFDFLSDWAIPLSATTALLLVIATFVMIRENRRATLQSEVRLFANNTLLTLRTKEPTELKEQIGLIIRETANMVTNARGISNEAYNRANKALDVAKEFEEKLEKLLKEEIEEAEYRESYRNILSAFGALVDATV